MLLIKENISQLLTIVLSLFDYSLILSLTKVLFCSTIVILIILYFFLIDYIYPKSNLVFLVRLQFYPKPNHSFIFVRLQFYPKPKHSFIFVRLQFYPKSYYIYPKSCYSFSCSTIVLSLFDYCYSFILSLTIVFFCSTIVLSYTGNKTY